MTSLIDGVAFSALSLRSFDDESLATAVIGELMKAPDPLRPTKFGPYEPLSKIPRGTTGPLIDAWLNRDIRKQGRVPHRSLILLQGRQGVGYHFSWRKDELPAFSGASATIRFSVMRDRPSVFQTWLSLCKRLVQLTVPVYGEIRSMAIPNWDKPFDLQKRLPDIPWVSIYGEPYISFFGKTRIETAPFSKVERLPSGHFWLQASESVFEPVSESTKAEIRRHLGEDCFMSGRRSRYKDGRAPNFEALTGG